MTPAAPLGSNGMHCDPGGSRAGGSEVRSLVRSYAAIRGGVAGAAAEVRAAWAVVLAGHHGRLGG